MSPSPFSRFADVLPAGLADARKDMENITRGLLNNALNKLDLVSREEFDVQSQVLQRLESRLNELAARLDSLENHSDNAAASTHNNAAEPS